MKREVDERLAKLKREFEASLRIHPKSHTQNVDSTTNLNRLIGLGLTLDEAKYWLEHEPDFMPSVDSYHGKKSDDKLPKPLNLRFSGLDTPKVPQFCPFLEEASRLTLAWRYKVEIIHSRFDLLAAHKFCPVSSLPFFQPL